jgi:hypothetical protein
MDPIFKFLHSRDLDRVLKDGTIKIGSTNYYRHLEGIRWNEEFIRNRQAGKPVDGQWVGDSLESNVMLVVEDGEYSHDQLKQLAPPGQEPIFRTAPGIPIRLEGLIFGYGGPGGFIFFHQHGRFVFAKYGDVQRARWV